MIRTGRFRYNRRVSLSVNSVLKQTFGFDAFRPHQEEIVNAALGGRDLFAALPTGGGKSLCYQLPALLRPGLTVVVSPLIALMKDQVDAAREAGIGAAFLNSTLDAKASRATWSELRRGEIKLLYVAPERLAIEEFRVYLRELGVSAFAVDEAHCISEWGHEFRPDYRALHRLRSEFPGIPIAAFTATATPRVQTDVIEQLRLHKPLVVRASFDRTELLYRVQRKHAVDREIVAFVRAHADEPGIVYRGTRKAAEKTAAALIEAGVRAVVYHAGLSDKVRAKNQEAFVRDRAQVVVATIAFGMGIDKSNVRWIVHGDLPRSIEGYYQETGRAGRDGERAEVLLLWGAQDILMQRHHIDALEDDHAREVAKQNQRAMLQYVDAAVCRRTALLAHFDQHHPGNCRMCDVCLGHVERHDATVAAQKLLSAAVRTGERFGAHHLADIVTGNPTDRVLEFGHNRLPTFGVGRDEPREWWLALGSRLEGGGFLERAPTTSGRLGGFRLTAAGRALLRGARTFELAAEPAARSAINPTARTAGTSKAERDATRQAAMPAGAELRPDQRALFDCLRAVRRAAAEERGVPPYVIFSDKTLMVMARNRPTDAAGLLRCHGVGEAKLERYGELFLESIRSFLSRGCC